MLARLIHLTSPGHRLVRTLLGLYVVLLLLGSLLPLGSGVGGHDKVNHLLGYAGLMGLLMWSLPRWPVWQSWLSVFGFGVLIEGLQGLTSWRFFEWGDMLANGIGALLVIPLALAAKHGWQRLANANAD